MDRIILAFGLALVALGAGGYVATGAASVTALIPAFVGAPIAVVGWASGRAEGPRRRRWILAAGALALLGFGGAARGIPPAVRILGGEEAERPAAALLQVGMALLCLALLALVTGALIRARSQPRGDQSRSDQPRNHQPGGE